MRVTFKQIAKTTGVLMLALSMMMTGVFAAEEEMTSGEKLDAVMEVILQEYLNNDEIDEAMLFEGAMNGMFELLDPYSNFIAADDSENFTNSINRTYSGIGVQMNKMEDYVVITRVFSDGPADMADLRVNDKIIGVDGESIIGDTPSEAASQILGEAGTEVVLTIDRGGYVFDVTIVRAVVTIDAVEVLELSDYKAEVSDETASQIGVIRIESFTEDLGDELNDVLDEMEADGITHLIIDMRDNGGGYVTSGVQMLQRLVGNGPVLRFYDNEGYERIFTSSNLDPSFEIVALVNENSASATEFVAASIAESGVGTLVGETTFGKGVAQFVYDMEDGSIFKLTQEEFRSGSGAVIDGVGVTPEYIVEIPEFVPADHKIYPGDEYEAVMNLEELLAYLGYTVDTPDYVYDEVSAAAVTQFQEDQGLYAYGVCDITTQEFLNDALIAYYREHDIQMEKGIEVLLEMMAD